MDAIFVEPVAMRRAAFWIDCSFAIDETDALGDQMGDAYVRMGFMIVLYVWRRVSLW